MSTKFSARNTQKTQPPKADLLERSGVSQSKRAANTTSINCSWERPNFVHHTWTTRHLLGLYTLGLLSLRDETYSRQKQPRGGDLLLCERTFAHTFVDASDHRQGIALLINAETNAMTISSQTELIALIVQRLDKNASLMPVITDLHHGSYKPVKDPHIDGTPAVDTSVLIPTIRKPS